MVEELTSNQYPVTMNTKLKSLVDISRRYGSDPDYVIAGGGNTSYKDDRYIWVKASGVALATIDEAGFVQLDRHKLKVIGEKQYSDDVQRREAEVKEDLLAARVDPEKGLRPSVETSLHDLIEYPFVVHTHPTLVNALMCSQQAKEKTRELFGEEVLFVEPAAGYSLFVRVKELLPAYRRQYGRDPQVIFLQNHGVFVGADTTEEIDAIYDRIMTVLKEIIRPEEIRYLPIREETEQLRQEISRYAGGKHVVVRHNTLHRYFYGSREAFRRISVPFTPDILVYCGAEYLYSGKERLPEILGEVMQGFSEYRKKYDRDPRIILVKDYGLFALGEKEKVAVTAMDVYEDFMKVSTYTEVFGGPHPLSPETIGFILGWEVEHYRLKMSEEEE
jgi:rhamnose utilization protein RhaD (predicted bifunctional aldolase and dehydrogenase)